MSNQFVSLAVPSGNGVGAATDVSSFGASKTIVVAGDAQAQITVEFNNDAAQAGSWTPIRTFQNTGEFTVPVACKWMRVRVSNYNAYAGGSSDVSVGGTTEGTSFAALAAPAASGVGGSVDTSALGPYKTVQVGGRYRGTTIIEVSEDGGVTWSQPFSFGSQSPGAQSRVIAADFMRVRRVGVPKVDPGLPVVNVGATDSAGGGGGTGVDIENEGVPIAGNPHTTLDFVGLGVTAADAGGGTATITIPGGITAEDEGVPVTGNPHLTLNFAGAGVIASDAGGGVLLITIPGGGGIAGINVFDDGSPLVGNPYTDLDFTDGLTAADVGGVATISAPGLAGNTPGSVLFAGPGGTPDQDNANLFYNAATHRLGIGNAAPTTPLDVTGTTRTTNLAVTALTLGSLLFAAAAGAVSQDNANAFYDATNHRLGLGNAAPATTLDVTGIGTFQSVNVSSSGSAFYASADGASAGVSAANTGRLRYNNTAKKWQVSVDTGAYADIATGAAGMAIGGTVTSGTTGSALFIGAGPVLAQDNANYFWDTTNKRLGIGTAAPSFALHIVRPIPTDGLIQLQNTGTGGAATDGYASINCTNSTGTFQGSFGYAGATVAITHLRSLLFNYSGSNVDWIWANATNVSLRVGATNGAAFVEMGTGASAAVSAGSTIRFRYDQTGGVGVGALQLSINTAAYKGIAITEATSWGSAEQQAVLFSNTSNRIQTDKTNFFYDVTAAALRIGTNTALASPTSRLDIVSTNTSQASCISLKGAITNSYSNINFFNNSGTQQGAVGFANSAVGTTLANRNFLYTPGGGVDWVLSDSTTDYGRWYCTTGSVKYEASDGASAAVAASGKGALRYNNTTKTWQVSMDGGAWASLVTL